LTKNLDLSFELKFEIKEYHEDKLWVMSFNILFKLEIDNEMSGMVICQCLTLVDNTESFWQIKNHVKSEAWLFFYYDGVSCPVLENKTYWWNIWHGYMSFPLQKQQEKKS